MILILSSNLDKFVLGEILKLSITVMSAPSLESLVTMFCPMKPAPPVTITRFFSSSSSFPQVIGLSCMYNPIDI